MQSKYLKSLKPIKFLALFFVLFISLTIIYEFLPESQPAAEKLSNFGEMEGLIYRTPNLKVQCWHKGLLYASRGLSIFSSSDFGGTWTKVAVLGLPNTSWWGLTKHILGNRFKLIPKIRTMIDHKSGWGISLVRVLDDNTVLTISGGIYRGILEKGKVVSLVNVFNMKGAPLSQGWTDDNRGNVYIGQYLIDGHGSWHNQSEVYWSQNYGQTWGVRHVFPRSEIRHVHSLSYDSFRRLLWLTTGDEDKESEVLYSSNQGATFDTLGWGAQDWRIVSLQFTPDAIYWGTDNPYGLNSLCKYDWKTKKKQTWLKTCNPFYYSAQDETGRLYFSTASGEKSPEDCPENQFSELWMIPKENKPPQRLFALRKGEIHEWGTIEFAQGKSPGGWLAFTPINLKDHHYEVIVCKVKN